LRPRLHFLAREVAKRHDTNPKRINRERKHHDKATQSTAASAVNHFICLTEYMRFGNTSSPFTPLDGSPATTLSTAATCGNHFIIKH
jgi:hypothetical protein